MPEVQIVLVEPLYEGNVGSVARVMKNFGFSRLVLINPCRLGNEARAMASHAQDLLDTARVCSLEEVYAQSALTIATTGELSKTICNPMRMPYFEPSEIRSMVAEIEGTISVLFGRENWGLNNSEVAASDLICTIPTSPEYPILNLSHAVGVVCYELAHLPRGTYLLADRFEMTCLCDHISSFLDQIDHPPYKREGTMLLIRRLLARTQLTPREVSTLHGLLRRTEWYLNGGQQVLQDEDQADLPDRATE